MSDLSREYDYDQESPYASEALQLYPDFSAEPDAESPYEPGHIGEEVDTTIIGVDEQPDYFRYEATVAEQSFQRGRQTVIRKHLRKSLLPMRRLRKALFRSISAEGQSIDRMSTSQQWLLRETKLSERDLPADCSLHVGMNDSAMVRIGRNDDPDDKAGKIWTNALGGCTGIVGVARLVDHSVAAYVSHFDTLADQFQRSKDHDSGCLSEQSIYSFMGMAAEGSEIKAADIVIAYDRTAEQNPQYGDRSGSYGEWYFLDQLQVAAENLAKREGVNVHFLPYDAWQAAKGHELGVEIVDDAYEVRFGSQSFVKR